MPTVTRSLKFSIARLVMPLALFFAGIPGTVFSAQVSLSGKVVFSDGNPLAGVTVAVPTPTGQRKTQTDVQGNYSFSIEEGTYDQLRIRNMGTKLPGVPAMLEYVAVNPLIVSGNTLKNVTMPAFYRIHGTLRTPATVAVANAMLTVSSWSGTMTQLPNDQNTTASDGTYALFCIGGQVQLSVPTGSDSSLAAFQLRFNLTKDTLLDLAYTPAPVLSGVVKTADGIAVPGITVALVKDGIQHEKRTDSQGRYSFALSAGTVTELRVRAMGDTGSLYPANMEYSPVDSVVSYKNFTISGDLVRNVALPKFPLFSGTLLGAADVPLAGFTLTVYGWKSNMRQLPNDVATADSQGHFQLRCSLGDNQLVIDPPMGSSYSQATQNFSIASDSTAVTRISKGAVFTGKVLLSSRAPVSGVTVAISNGLVQKEAVTNSLGVFRIAAQPGRYADFRVRNMSADLDGVPRMLEYTVQPDGITLTDSLDLEVVLPPFRKVAGKVLDASLKPVPGIDVASSAWKSGMTQLPSDDCVSAGDGTYALFLPDGTNWITVRPPNGSAFATTSFTLKVDGPLVHDIILSDQAKGLASIQPSVVGQGKSGKITLIGVNTGFFPKVSTLDFGSGVVVTEITVHSDISITAQVAVSDTATPGVRSVRVVGDKGTYVGAELFTVTAPVASPLLFDGAGKLAKAVIIEDGTGTQLQVDSGTSVKLPPGAAQSLGFEAPMIKNDQVNPTAAEFIQVQREFSPAGVVFDPPASLTFHYSDQDVKGVDESKLVAYKYDNKADTVVAEYKVLARDTAKNLLKQEVTTFSLFRLAKSGGTNSLLKPAPKASRGTLHVTHLRALSGRGQGWVRLIYGLEGKNSYSDLRFRLVSMRGETVAELQLPARVGMEQVSDWRVAGGKSKTGCFQLIAEVDGTRWVQSLVLGL